MCAWNSGINVEKETPSSSVVNESEVKTEKNTKHCITYIKAKKGAFAHLFASEHCPFILSLNQ